ncbi:MAG: hypothetical protein IJX21_08920 [Alistipes sp.]|nr:hypothetical protein [Alistipes sp.]
MQPKIASAIQPLPLSHQGACIICTPPQHHATTATPLAPQYPPRESYTFPRLYALGGHNDSQSTAICDP